MHVFYFYSVALLMNCLKIFCQVEEIDDIDGNINDPFVAAAIANEKELDLSEEQKNNFRKVCRHVLLLNIVLSIFLLYCPLYDS